MKNNIVEIYQSAVKLSVPLSPDELYKTIVDEACKLTDAKQGSIFLGEKGRLRRVYSNIPEKAQFEPRENGFTYKTFREQKIYLMTKKIIVRTHPELEDNSIQSIVLIPLSNNKQSIGVLTLRDTQREHFTAQKLEVLDLFGTLASLKIDSMKLFEEKKQALASRDLFIAMAAHELKTPLTVITGYTQLIQKKALEKQPISTQFTSTLLAEVQRLTELVNELLSIEETSTGSVIAAFRPFNFERVLNQTTKYFKVSFPKRALKVIGQETLPEDKKILGNPNKILQVLINLFNNAVKFSPKNSEITFAVSSTESTLEVKVIDTGKGISKKDLPNVFDRFYKGKGSDHEGMGLGLYLCKSIIEQHGGTIQILSQKGKGTTVQILLPYYKSNVKRNRSKTRGI